MIEGESVSGPPLGESGPEKDIEIELSPEQKAVIDAKRKNLLSSTKLTFRFVSLKEYLDTTGTGETDRKLEANLTTIDDLRSRTNYDPPGLFHPTTTSSLLDRKFGDEPVLPGDFSETWAAVADEFTGWTSSSTQILNTKILLQKYREISHATRERGASRGDARFEFVQYLLEGARHFMRILHAAGEEKYMMGDEREKSIPQDELIRRIQTEHESMDDEDRKKLSELLQKEPGEITRPEIKFLMRFNREILSGKTGHGNLAYEVLEIWDRDVHQITKGDLFGWIPKGTNANNLLGVLALYPDREFYKKLANNMQVVSQQNPDKAHVVIDIHGEEYYPDKDSTDYILVERNLVNRAMESLSDEEVKTTIRNLSSEVKLRINDRNFLKFILGQLYFRIARQQQREKAILNSRKGSKQGKEFVQGQTIAMNQKIVIVESLLGEVALQDIVKEFSQSGKYLNQIASMTAGYRIVNKRMFNAWHNEYQMERVIEDIEPHGEISDGITNAYEEVKKQAEEQSRQHHNKKGPSYRSPLDDIEEARLIAMQKVQKTENQLPQ